MNVLIVGYGNMGKEIDRTLQDRGHAVVGRIDPLASGVDAKELTPQLLDAADTAIEFSLSEAVVDNARHYAESGIKAVIGTTNWSENHGVVEEMFGERGACIHGSNFSIGANLFFDLVERAAAAISGLSQYDIMMYEVHHGNKKDSPSGTALTTAERILKAHDGKTNIVTSRLDRRPEPNELHVASVRGGSIPGTHTVLLDSVADTIEIKHTARGRSGFALGAVLAAEWLQERSGFFTIEDFIRDLTDRGDTA
jgi:4-hydroxy-tetrahydrodipicolinate reductase